MQTDIIVIGQGGKMKDKAVVTFGNSMKKIMKAIGLTQKEFASQLGLDVTRFNQKLNNNCSASFSLSEMLKISRELGESIEDLATGNIDIDD